MTLKTIALVPLAIATTVVMAADISIEQPTFDSVVKITASTDQYAGAVYSIKFRGKEYIDTKDHGREFQSASSFDGYTECFNPTEAGNTTDGNGPTSTSVLLTYSIVSNVLRTSTRMAFFLPSGFNYGRPCSEEPNPPANTPTHAINQTNLSDHVLEKAVSLGYNGIPNVIQYTASFNVGEPHWKATFEPLAAFLTPDFTELRVYDASKRVLSRLSAALGEQAWPVIVATKDGRHAMGVTSFDIPKTNSIYTNGPVYGRFLLPGDTTKYNCVFREGAVTTAKYTYTCLASIGTVDEVMQAHNGMYSSANQPVPIFRFLRNSDRLLTTSYTEGATANYAFEATAFRVHATNIDGTMVPIYRCTKASGNHLISGSVGCEGVQLDGLLGYVSPSPRAGYVALYRFYKSATDDHLITTDYSEGSNAGYSFEGTVGYALSSN